MHLPQFPALGLAFLAGVFLSTSAIAVVTTTDSFGSGGNTFTMDFVTIGNPGNPADTTGAPKPGGAVAYEFRMGVYEVSEGMIDKANAAGGLDIGHDNRGANKPATSISWNEAARFVNWLNQTSGSTAAYKFTTQPGEVGYGAGLNSTLWQPGDEGYDAANPFRNSNAKYFLPSDNEWYKAAYYSGATNYFDFATGSDTIPGAVTGGTAAGTAVYGQSFGTGPSDVTNAGGLSPYGTMGQGGNAGEWLETETDGSNNNSTGSRVLRGGAWYNDEDSLRSTDRLGNLTTDECVEVGFRVASVVPEPSALVLTVLFSAGLLTRRKR